MGNVTKWVSWLILEDRDEAPWGMGHMANGAHGQQGHIGNGTWAKGYQG